MIVKAVQHSVTFLARLTILSIFRRYKDMDRVCFYLFVYSVSVCFFFFHPPDAHATFGKVPSSALKFGLLTRSALRQLSVHVVVLLLERLDVAPLAEEEVGGHHLARNQDAGQQGYPCDFIGPAGTAPEKQAQKEGGERDMFN